MSLDLTKILMNSTTSSLKIWKQDSGSINLPSIESGGGTSWKTVPILHGYPNDRLIWQVGLRETDGHFFNNIMTPFETSGGTLNAFATLDDTNLYISVGWETSSIPATSFDYIYRLLIP